MARRSLDRALGAGDLPRFLAVAQRYQLVTEAAELVASRRSPDEAAEFARTAGDEGLARRLFRRAHDGHAARGHHQRAAASAEAAGCYDLAVRALRRLPDGGGVRARAQLAERHGHHRDAVLAYLDAECGGDALRVAEAGGLLEVLLDEVDGRSDAALWRIGANAAVQIGAPSRAVELCLRAGDLNLARSIARRAGLGAFEREIDLLLRARRNRERRDLLHGHGRLHREDGLAPGRPAPTPPPSRRRRTPTPPARRRSVRPGTSMLSFE
ncbi:MAG: hypothetical protein ACYTGX_16650 [Planctomycetota bacterium]|jgi:hypothetical protein